MRVTVLLLALSLSGCFRTTLSAGMPEQGKPENADFSATWIYGLTPVQARGSEAICKYGISRVETGMPGWGGLIFWLTAGLVGVMETRYQCVAEPSAPWRAPPACVQPGTVPLPPAPPAQ